MNLMIIERITEDIGDLKACKKIDVDGLNQLGYIMSDRKLVISRNDEDTPTFFITEILSEDDKKAASFCYLYILNRKTGVILRHPYDYYLSMV